MDRMTGLADELILVRSRDTAPDEHFLGDWTFYCAEGMVAGSRATFLTLMAHYTHGRVIIWGADKDRPFYPHLAGYAVGGMAGETLHVPLVIQGEDGRDFHTRGRRFVDGMTMVIVDLSPGVSHTAVMTGKTHFWFGNRLCCLLIGDQVCSLAIDEKGVDPSIVTDRTLLGRVRVAGSLIGERGRMVQEYGTEKEKKGAG